MNRDYFDTKKTLRTIKTWGNVCCSKNSSIFNSKIAARVIPTIISDREFSVAYLFLSIVKK